MISIVSVISILELCLAGESTIPKRKAILAVKRSSLLERQKQIQDCIDYIDWKQSFYDDVLSGKTEYYSNLINTDDPDNDPERESRKKNQKQSRKEAWK